MNGEIHDADHFNLLDGFFRVRRFCEFQSKHTYSLYGSTLVLFVTANVDVVARSCSVHALVIIIGYYWPFMHGKRHNQQFESIRVGTHMWAIQWQSVCCMGKCVVCVCVCGTKRHRESGSNLIFHVQRKRALCLWPSVYCIGHAINNFYGHFSTVTIHKSWMNANATQDKYIYAMPPFSFSLQFLCSMFSLSWLRTKFLLCHLLFLPHTVIFSVRVFWPKQ